MRFNIWFLFIIISILFSCGRKYVQEVEPNHSRWQAQIINVPIKIKGTIEKKSDVDYFKFVNTDEGEFDIELILKTKYKNPLKLSLYFQDKVIKSVYLLKSEFENNENIIRIKNIYIRKGTYFIRITQRREWKRAIPYILTINKLSFNTFEEMEPNDTIGDANEIDITEGYIKGYFSPQWNCADSASKFREVDWFKFFVSDESNLISIALTGTPDIDPIVELYNELGIMLKKIDGFGIDEPEVLKNYGIMQPGYYYAKIYPKNIGQKNDNISYKFYVNIEKYKKEFEFEPNDSMNNANYLKDSVKGFINPPGDVDWFTFTIDSNKASLLNISITPLSDIDIIVKLYSHMGEKLFELNSYSVNESEFFPDLYILSGKYFITVSDAKNKFQNINSPYTLSIKFFPYAKEFEIEPNNSFDNATMIKLNTPFKGYISPKADIDYYKFSLGSNKRLKFRISPVPAVDFMIEIYSANRELITNINNNQASEGELGYVELNAGIYYVILRDAENKNSNYYENYIFTILER